MRNTPLAAIPVPDSTDVADVPTHLHNAVAEAEKHFNLVFASSTARDAAFVTASVTPVDGLKCYLSDTDTQQTYLNGVWTSQEPTVLCTSGTRPASPTHIGMTIYETDTYLVRRWNGSAWVADRISATSSGTTDNPNGDLTITHGLGKTPSAVIVSPTGTDSPNNIAKVNVHTITSTTFKVRFFRTDTGGILVGEGNCYVSWVAFP
jgi:hypothetical protein